MTHQMGRCRLDLHTSLSKWAIEGLSQALAQELPGGMAALALNPGIIDTDTLRSCFGGSAADYLSPDPNPRPNLDQTETSRC